MELVTPGGVPWSIYWSGGPYVRRVLIRRGGAASLVKRNGRKAVRVGNGGTVARFEHEVSEFRKMNGVRKRRRDEIVEIEVVTLWIFVGDLLQVAIERARHLISTGGLESTVRG